jgi:hypothetical protein
MAHRVASSAERDLDEIWYHVAKESGSFGIADGLIDSITDLFFFSLPSPTSGVPATKFLALAAAPSLWAIT